MADVSVSTIQSPIVPMLPLRESTWATGVVGVATRTLAVMTGMMTGTAVTVTRTGVVTTGTTGTVTTTAGIAGTGATAAALLLGLATHRSTEGAGATRGALRGVAALAVVGTTMGPRPAGPRTATLAGEALVR